MCLAEVQTRILSLHAPTPVPPDSTTKMAAGYVRQAIIVTVRTQNNVTKGNTPVRGPLPARRAHLERIPIKRALLGAQLSSVDGMVVGPTIAITEERRNRNSVAWDITARQVARLAQSVQQGRIAILQPLVPPLSVNLEGSRLRKVQVIVQNALQGLMSTSMDQPLVANVALGASKAPPVRRTARLAQNKPVLVVKERFWSRPTLGPRTLGNAMRSASVTQHLFLLFASIAP